MRNGIFIPATVVRLAMGALALVTVAVIASEAPELVRYAKIKKM
ncbi:MULTISPECIES: hypothetical protein [Streptomyces]|nr:hypothetical protein [Streptomyces sp. JHD 1]MCX2969189.1 hypothetical protein [Streptomyces sp. JHD 1]